MYIRKFHTFLICLISGLKVYYSNGEAVEHGSREEAKSSLYNFRLGDEERIVQVEKCRSCNSLNGILYNLINKLTFMTNKGRELILLKCYVS